MRLFVAVGVPVDVQDAIETAIVDVLRPEIDGARWTRPEGRHLTLAFLGEVAEERIGNVASAISAAAAGHGAFDASFAEVGGFPNLRRPRVLWVGLGTGRDEMVPLAGDVQEALVPTGYEREERPFLPHLTLARFPKPRTVEIPEVRVPSATFRVADVVLFRSQLHPKGARYTQLERFALNAQ